MEERRAAEQEMTLRVYLCAECNAWHLEVLEHNNITDEDVLQWNDEYGEFAFEGAHDALTFFGDAL